MIGLYEGVVRSFPWKHTGEINSAQRRGSSFYVNPCGGDKKSETRTAPAAGVRSPPR